MVSRLVLALIQLDVTLKYLLNINLDEIFNVKYICYFQNLPELQLLDLAYNSMSYFDFDYLDQVGTLAALNVNISHNIINSLVDNSSNFGFTKDHSEKPKMNRRSLFFQMIIMSIFSLLPFQYKDLGYVE